jgi:hypothetical protein
MQEVARVVVALEANEVAEEVMHFLDRSGTARVVATAADDRQLIEAVRQLDPDAVVAQPSLVEPAAVRGPAVLALDTRESVSALRAAIRVGARGFYLWPGERDALAGAAGRPSRLNTSARSVPSSSRCTVLAVASGPPSSRPTSRRRWLDAISIACWSMATRPTATYRPCSALPTTCTRSPTCCRW